MRDDLIEAVSQLRMLKEDVECLNAVGDDSGEVRYLRLLEDVTTTADEVELGRLDDDFSRWIVICDH